ncbi:MAG: pilus assembly protein PilM [Roseburia sp.]|nr:pilus assembly protein PilM [Roseburia sp.]
MDFRVKNPKIYKYFCIPTPQGVLEDGFVQENAEFALSIRRALSENKIRTKNVVFSVTSSKIVTREITIPAIKMNQVGGYVRANANDYFPIDLSVYEIAHVVLGVEKEEGGKDKYRVMVMAAGKDLIAGYAQFAASCGLRLSSVDYTGNGVYQVMKNECGDVPTLVIKVEDNSTIASVIANNSLILQRNLAYGIERAVNTLMESPEFYESSYKEAFHTICQRACVKVALSDRTRVQEYDEAVDESQQAAEARAKITATFSQLIGNLVRVVELYNSKEPLNPIQQVIMVGLGGEVKNLSKLFTNEMGIPTKVLRTLSSVTTYQSMEEPNLGRYVGPVGAGIESVGLVNVESKQKGVKKVNYAPLTVLVIILFMGIIAAICIMAYLPYKEAKDTETSLLAKEKQYAEAEVVHNQYLAVEGLYNDLEEKYKLTKNPNDNMVSFLQELEEKLPSDVNLTTLTSDTEKASMIFKVADYEEAAKVLQILRSFASVRDVTVGNASEESNQETDAGDVRISFEAICYYWPDGILETQETGEAEGTEETVETEE